LVYSNIGERACQKIWGEGGIGKYFLLFKVVTCWGNLQPNFF